MSYKRRARTTRRNPRLLGGGLLLVVAAIAAPLGYQFLASSSSTSASPVDVLGDEPPHPRSEHRVPRSEPRGALGVADGALPDGVGVF
jgi:zinc D-Ala-D-Ala carboxypeptidase